MAGYTFKIQGVAETRSARVSGSSWVQLAKKVPSKGRPTLTSTQLAALQTYAVLGEDVVDRLTSGICLLLGRWAVAPCGCAEGPR